MSFRRNIETVFILLALASIGAAQTSDDPVSRAMKSIDAAVEPRASAATRVIEGSKFVNDSAVARRQDERELAIESLKRAEAIASESKQPQPSFLLDALSLAIAAERVALNSKASE